MKDLNGESAGENGYGHFGNLAIAIKFNPNLAQSLNQVLQTIADGASLVGGLVSMGATDIVSAAQGEDMLSGRQLSNTDKGIIVIGSLAGGIGDDIVKGLNKLPIAKSAVTKLDNIVQQSSLSKVDILDKAPDATKYIDHRNDGNINSFIDKPGSPKKMFRVTTNPEQTRIISAGTIEKKSVINNIKKKLFTKKKK